MNNKGISVIIHLENAFDDSKLNYKIQYQTKLKDFRFMCAPKSEYRLQISL